MTATQLANYIWFETKTNSTTFPDDKMTLLANIAKNFIIGEVISQIGETAFGMDSYTDLVAGDRIYKLDQDTLQFRRAWVKLDGVNEIPLLPISELGIDDDEIPTTEEAIIKRFGDITDKGYYDIFRGSIYIYSPAIPDVSEGLHLWDLKVPDDFTTMTGITELATAPSLTTNGIPGKLHELIGRKVIILFKDAGDKPIPLTETQRSFNLDLQRAINQMKTKDNDTTTRIAIEDQGYDNGHNL
jgi:hypothetical protein